MQRTRTVVDESAASDANPTPALRPMQRRAARLVALDAFRGMAIAGMILVNNPGSSKEVYDALQHSDWNGCTFADLIFPFFLFIVGVAITLSFANRGRHRGARVSSVLRRTAILGALGLMLNGFPYFDWEIMRVPGILQRIALCYCAAAFIVMACDVRGQVIAMWALLAAYWALMKLVPVPGFGAGGLGPGKNLAAYLDQTLIPGHLLHHHWDPEGVLSTLPAIATTLAGVLTGHWLRTNRPPLARVTGLLIAGNAGMLFGLMADHWFPINKSLWSPSYVLFTAGVALVVLGVCYWLIDVKGYERWAKPLVVYGTNPIVAYVLSSLMAKAMLLWRVPLADGTKMHIKQFVFDYAFLSWASPIDASLYYAVAYTLLWLALTWLLYRQRIFIKI